MFFVSIRILGIRGLCKNSSGKCLNVDVNFSITVHSAFLCVLLVIANDAIWLAKLQDFSVRFGKQKIENMMSIWLQTLILIRKKF
jgi:hypothetical protein